MRSWKTRLTAFGDYCRVPQSKQDLKYLSWGPVDRGQRCLPVKTYRAFC